MVTVLTVSYRCSFDCFLWKWRNFEHFKCHYFDKVLEKFRDSISKNTCVNC